MMVIPDLQNQKISAIVVQGNEVPVLWLFFEKIISKTV